MESSKVTDEVGEKADEPRALPKGDSCAYMLPHEKQPALSFNSPVPGHVRLGASTFNYRPRRWNAHHYVYVP